MGRYKRKSSNSKTNLQFKYKVNQYIKAERLFVIDEAGEQLGELDKIAALKIASDKGLDLVEVSPKSKPPVAKIISWSKFKYDQNKKRKETKIKTKDQKEIWFNVNIGKRDMEHKLKRVEKFLGKEHPVKLTVRAKGRTNRDNMRDLMNSIVKTLGKEILYDSIPKFEGRNFAIIVKPVKK